MKIYATVQLDEGETLAKSAVELSAELMAALGADAATDSCQVTVTATASTEPPTPPE